MAYDAFLKLIPAAGGPTVTGESTDIVHKGEIQLTGYNIGLTRARNIGSATGGAGAGKATFNDFSFTTGESRASLGLFQACASGTHFNEAIVSLRKAGGERQGLEFLKITMSTVFVTNFNSGGSAGDDLPHDEVHLAYGKIQFQYTPQNPDGGAGTPVTAGWDLQKNTQA